MLNGNEGHSAAVNSLADWLSACAHEGTPAGSVSHMGTPDETQDLLSSSASHAWVTSSCVVPDEEPSITVKVWSAEYDSTVSKTPCFISIHSAQYRSHFDASLYLVGISPRSRPEEKQLYT